MVSVCPLLSVTAWRRSFFCNANRLSFTSLSSVRRDKACLCNPWSSWSFHMSSAETTARECNVLSCVSAASCAHSPTEIGHLGLGSRRQNSLSISTLTFQGSSLLNRSSLKPPHSPVSDLPATRIPFLNYLDSHWSRAESRDPQITVLDTVVALIESISTHASGSSICSTRISSRLLDLVIGLSALLLSSSDSRPLILQLFVEYKLDEHGALDCSSNWSVLPHFFLRRFTALGGSLAKHFLQTVRSQLNFFIETGTADHYLLRSAT